MITVIYRKLDTNDDFVFGSGQNAFLTDIDAVGQAIKTKLRFLRGEWWEDQSLGLPLFQQILSTVKYNGAHNAADLLIQEQILSVPNVTGVTDYQSTFDPISRTYQAQCNVNTVFGTINLAIPSIIPSL